MKERMQRLYGSMSPAVAVLGAAVIVFVAVLLVMVLTGRAGIPAAIMIAAIPVTIGLLGQFVSSDRQNKREIEAKLRERKSGVYEGFIQLWMDTLMRGRIQQGQGKRQQNPNQIAKDMNESNKAMMLWASNEVVQSWTQFRRRFNNADTEQSQEWHMENLLLLENIMLLMRKDMGHDPQGLEKWDLLYLFINDLDAYRKQNEEIEKKREEFRRNNPKGIITG